MVMAALCGLTTYALIQKARAETNEETAESRRKDAVEQKEEAERQTRIATAQRLAAQAEEVAERYPQRSTLLAAEAVQVALRAKESPHAAARQSLQQALGRIGGKSLEGHEHWVLALAISPDGRWLASGGEDRTVRLWYLQADDLLRVAAVTVGRNFTRAEWEQYFPGQPYRKTFPDLPGPEGRD